MERYYPAAANKTAFSGEATTRVQTGKHRARRNLTFDDSIEPEDSNRIPDDPNNYETKGAEQESEQSNATLENEDSREPIIQNNTAPKYDKRVYQLDVPFPSSEPETTDLTMDEVILACGWAATRCALWTSSIDSTPLLDFANELGDVALIS